VMDPSARGDRQHVKHHEQPRYIMGAGAPQMLMGAPVINHTGRLTHHAGRPARRRPPFYRHYPAERNLSAY